MSDRKLDLELVADRIHEIILDAEFTEALVDVNNGIIKHDPDIAAALVALGAKMVMLRDIALEAYDAFSEALKNAGAVEITGLQPGGIIIDDEVTV